MSKHRRKEVEEYRRLAKIFLSQNPKCRHCSHPATEVHHFAGRLGRLLTYTPLFHAVCQSCHDWIHRNIGRAIQAGMIAGKGRWNVFPKNAKV